MKLDRKYKILIAIIIVEGIFIASLLLPTTFFPPLQIQKFYFGEIDQYTRANILAKGYTIVEFYFNYSNLEFLNKLDKEFNNQLVFIIHSYEMQINEIHLSRACANYFECQKSQIVEISTDLNNLEKDLCKIVLNVPAKCLQE